VKIPPFPPGPPHKFFPAGVRSWTLFPPCDEAGLSLFFFFETQTPSPSPGAARRAVCFSFPGLLVSVVHVFLPPSLCQRSGQGALFFFFVATGWAFPPARPWWGRAPVGFFLGVSPSGRPALLYFRKRVSPWAPSLFFWGAARSGLARQAPPSWQGGRKPFPRNVPCPLSLCTRRSQKPPPPA